MSRDYLGKASGKLSCKISLYFNRQMLTEVRAEAHRLDRSVGWVVQQSWRIARAEIRKLPTRIDFEAP